MKRNASWKWSSIVLVLLMISGCTIVPAAVQPTVSLAPIETAVLSNTPEPEQEIPPQESPAPALTEAVPTDTPLPVQTLTIVLPFGGNDYLQLAIADFMKEHPGLQIVCKENATIPVPGEETDTIDILGLFSNGRSLHDFYHAGVLEPLQDYAAIKEVLEDTRLIPGVMDAFWVDDNLAAVPLDYHVRAFIIREDSLDKAGVTMPEADWDWFDFFQTLENATDDADGDGKQDGLPVMPYGYHAMASAYWPVFF